MADIVVPVSDRTIDQRCARCGGQWREHSSGGHCELRRVPEIGFWTDPRVPTGRADPRGDVGG